MHPARQRACLIRTTEISVNSLFSGAEARKNGAIRHGGIHPLIDPNCSDILSFTRANLEDIQFRVELIRTNG